MTGRKALLATLIVGVLTGFGVFGEWLKARSTARAFAGVAEGPASFLSVCLAPLGEDLSIVLAQADFAKPPGPSPWDGADPWVDAEGVALAVTIFDRQPFHEISDHFAINEEGTEQVSVWVEDADGDLLDQIAAAVEPHAWHFDATANAERRDAIWRLSPPVRMAGLSMATAERDERLNDLRHLTCHNYPPSALVLSE
ncbi:MAG: hypothetical protein AAF192_04710 [Pseudomonadota bacterium]